jgi:hypothetical protein
MAAECQLKSFKKGAHEAQNELASKFNSSTNIISKWLLSVVNGIEFEKCSLAAGIDKTALRWLKGHRELRK